VVSAEPEVRLDQIAMLADDERRELVHGWNQTLEDDGDSQCVHERFEARAAKCPEAIAVQLSRGMRQDGKEYQLSYGELEWRANQMARCLRKHGVTIEARVGLSVGRSLELAVGVLGILKSGGAYVPLDLSQPGERLQSLIEGSGINVVVAGEAEWRRLRDLVPGLSLVRFEECLEERGSRLDVGVSGQNAAYVIYTSGSTGTPKGVVVSHASVVNHNVAVTRRFALEAADRVLQFHTISFDAAVEELFPTWGAGAAVVMKGEEFVSPGSELDTLIAEERLTVLNLPTAYWHEWVMEGARRKRIAAKGLRLVIVGGDKVSAERYAMWKTLTGGAIRWLNTFGPTETTVISSLWEPEEGDQGEVSGGMSIGRPIANTRMYVLDAGMEPVPVGIAGELWIGGLGLARGYLGRPDLTAERFLPDPFVEQEGARMYRTGDRARYKPDGRLEFLGRVDEQVKIRGFRVEPAEIESALLNHPRVDKAVVTGWKASDTETRLVAYVVPVADSAAEASLVPQLRGYLQGALPDYMAPSSIVLLDSLPMTAGGKVNRRLLPEPEPILSERAGYVAPRTHAEEVLAKIWAEALGVERVGVHDNFFELGGDSLLGVRIIARANSAGLALSVKQIFQRQTIAKLALAAADIRLARLGPRPRDARVPLSFAQEGFWFIDRLQPGVPFNIPIAIRLEGLLDIDALQTALNALVARHEVLRTTFSEVDGQPVQIVASSNPVSITTVSIPPGDVSERTSELLKQVIASARAAFDLSSGPLLRMTVFELDIEDHVLMLTVHHTVFDGSSVALFARELAALYTSVVSGTAPVLPDLPIQYADYAIWQRELLQGEFLESQLQYWAKQLAEHPAGLTLPTDRPESTAQLFLGEVVSLRLSGALSGGLRALGRNEGSTLFMVLLAAYQLLLARYSGQDDIVVGTPVANRDQPAQEHLIGACINVLALRTDLSGNPSFRQLVQRVREVCLEAYSHQDLPFGLLVQRLHPDRHMARSPIFQVQFALQTVRTGLSLPGLRVSPLLDVGSLSKELKDLMIGATPATDHLFLQAADIGTEITAEMQYRSDLFDAGTVQRMMRHLQRLLEGVVADPDRPVFEIPMLEAEELRQQLVEWNPPAHAVPQGILVHHLFEAEAERAPEAAAVIVPSAGSDQAAEERLTYRELNQRANQLAHILRSRGAGPDVRVGICLARSPEAIVAILGVLKAGAAYVPLDPTYPGERLHYMVADAQIRLLLTRKGLLADSLEGVQAIEWDSWREMQDEAADGNPELSIDDEQLAYVIYTSGSTGRPKGVMVSHRSLVSAYRAWEDAYDLRAVRRHLQMASVSFDVFAGDWIRALCSGGTLVLCPLEALLTPADLYRLLRVHDVDCAEFVPAVMRPLVEYLGRSGERLEFMKRIVVGSDIWSCREFEQVQRLAGAARVTNSYGAAEATIDSAYLESLPGEPRGDRPVPIGRPFANTQIYVLDQRLQPVPVGVAGELHIGGAGLARGYLNRPDLTAEQFIPNPFSSERGARLYRTGDRARFLPDGNIEFLGRLDHQIKIRGFRVEVGEIEAVLSEHPAVREAVVVGHDEPAGARSVLAYAVLRQDADVNAGTLRVFLERQLPHYMVPSEVIVLGGFPLTPSGKVDRRRLPRPTGQRPELTETYVAPRSPTERKLAHIWSEELRVDRVGIADNFFALGGHSLLAAKVVSRVIKELLVDLPLRELFLHPTVAGLALAVDLALATGRTTTKDDLDLASEAELDVSIAPNEDRSQFSTEVGGVFLTGATGFIGAYLLRELLKTTGADVYCLVRATSREHGLKRLRDALEKYDLWEEAASTRIVPVMGDLCEPRLGLSDEHYSGLARSVDMIYHVGAEVNAIYPYAMLKPSNVLGTQEVLRLACETKVKPVHFVSTIGIFPAERLASGAIDETWPIDGCDFPRGGYNQSKWVAERLVSIAAKRGLPIAIYRPGRVAGDSRTGMWKPDQIFIESLNAVLELGSVPRVSHDVPFDLVPVDYVARAIVCLSGQPESVGKAFHLVNPQPTSWWAFVRRFGDLGLPLQELEPEDWHAELLRFVRSTPTSFLNSLLPVLSQGLQLANMERTAAHPAGVPGRDDTAPFAGRPGNRPSAPLIDCTNTLRGLKASQVTCTPAGELLDLHLSYLVRSGVLSAGGEARGRR
jgi:amino acid adenylation domain-containing protein/thioester reductase-like protein